MRCGKIESSLSLSLPPPSAPLFPATAELRWRSSNDYPPFSSTSSQPLSLYHPCSFLSIDLSFSLTAQGKTKGRPPIRRGQTLTRAGASDSKGIEWSRVSSVEANSQRWRCVQHSCRSHGLTVTDRRPLMSLIVTLGLNNFISASSSKWYPPFLKKVPRSLAYISVQENENFANGSEPNGALFWGNDPEFTLVTKNSFQQYIIYLCLKSFAKSHIFQDRLWNWQLKFTLFACKTNQD